MVTEIADLFEAQCCLDNENILWKKIDGEWIGKPGIQLKNLGWVWFEDAKLDEIDTRYFNIYGEKI